MEQKTETKKRPTFYSLLNRPKTIPSKSGQKLYKWNFYNKTGELEERETNIHEQIQSFARQVDYKQKIKRGEELNDSEGVYMDVSKLGTDYSSINQYLSNLASSIKMEIEKSSTPKANEEAPAQSGATSTQVPEATNQNEGGNTE